jgi:hypothetical protein
MKGSYHVTITSYIMGLHIFPRVLLLDSGDRVIKITVHVRGVKNYSPLGLRSVIFKSVWTAIHVLVIGVIREELSWDA